MRPQVVGRVVGVATALAIAASWMGLPATIDPDLGGLAGFPILVAWGAVLVGLPIAYCAGGAIGKRAAVRVECRRTVLLVVAMAVTLAVTFAMRCITYELSRPTFADLYGVTFAPTALAALALERWTRPRPVLPTAITL